MCRSRAPAAGRPIRHASPSSARPPARRFTAVAPAPNHSTISNASERSMAVAFHRLEIIDVRRETPEAVSIAFAVPPDLAEAYGFAPGQHLTLRTMMGGAEVRRSYSISSGLDDGELRVVVKKVEGGLFSRFINEKVEAGDEIDVM